MPAPEFVFSVELSKPADPGRGDAMMTDLAQGLLRQAGFDGRAAAELSAEIRDAVSSALAADPRACTLQVRAAHGELSVSVSGGAAWRTTRPLPQ